MSQQQKQQLISEIVKLSIQAKSALHSEDYDMFEEYSNMKAQLQQQLNA